MGRFFLTLGVGLALFLGVAWGFGLFVQPQDNTDGLSNSSDKTPARDLGALLYPAKLLPPEPPPQENGRVADPIVIAGHIVAQDKTELGAQVDGQIMFIGEQVPHEAVCLAGAAPFTADPFLHTFISQAGQDLTIIYRRFRQDQVIEKHQMVALLDPAKAMNELAKMNAKVKAAEEEYKGAVLTYREAENRYLQAETLFRKGSGFIAAEEYREKKLARDKFFTESEAKLAAIVVAKNDADSAIIVLKQHSIRNPIDRAFIKAFYHGQGDSVKNQDPILQLYSTYQVVAEGQVEIQYRDRLYEKMAVIVEPTYEDAPFRTLRGHKQEVNAVAVSKDGKLFVSVSEDRTANVWVKEMNVPKWVLQHHEPVRSVVCAPPGCKENWCLTGCANGTIYVWNLDQPDKEPVKLGGEHGHRDAITALAFSPDGAYFASGSADNSIMIWKTGEEKPLYTIDDHAPAGPVTSLAFTPQTRLVSASRDNTLRVWDLHEKGAKIVGEPIGGRAGNVNQLGVSNDGRFMLFDQGKTMQLLSVQSGRTTSILQNVVGGMSFDTLALFAPDASLLLTAGGADGRLQLWRSPTSFSRGYEVRQFVSEDKSPVTCAAFAPDAGLAAAGVASFAISGSKDGNVYLWPVPNKQAVETHRIRNATLTNLGQAAEAGTRQVRVGVKLNNPDGRLMDGRPATIVIEP